MVRSVSYLCVSLILGCASARGEEVSELDQLDDACAEQIEESDDGLPDDLSCTDLFKDIERGKLAKGVVPFEPAFALWSDGAGKTRWIKLPEDEGIDSSDMSRWRFPKGTQLWKEFRADGARVETRMYRKVRSDKWVHTTYLWNEKGSEAKRLDTGKQLTRNGVDYVVPKAGQCDDCHDGRPDNVLGFDAVSLGLGDPEREGWTLRKLMAESRLTDVPSESQLEIGDDGTGKAAAALGWLHINCGVTCHNEGVNSKAETTGLRMDLDPLQLDGRKSHDFRTRRLLLDVPAVTEQWRGQARIVPGKPEESLLYRLITTRIGTDSNKQMPPLASRLVDEDNTAKIREWIVALGETQH